SCRKIPTGIAAPDETAGCMQPATSRSADRDAKTAAAGPARSRCRGQAFGLTAEWRGCLAADRRAPGARRQIVGLVTDAIPQDASLRAHGRGEGLGIGIWPAV